MNRTPISSNRFETASLSSKVSDIPTCCAPSLNVVSYNAISFVSSLNASLLFFAFVIEERFSSSSAGGGELVFRTLLGGGGSFLVLLLRESWTIFRSVLFF